MILILVRSSDCIVSAGHKTALSYLAYGFVSLRLTYFLFLLHDLLRSSLSVAFYFRNHFREGSIAKPKNRQGTQPTNAVAMS